MTKNEIIGAERPMATATKEVSMTHSVRSMLSSAIALALAASAFVLPAAPAQALEKIPLTLAWVIGGSNGPLYLAIDRGYFAAEGLEIDAVPGDGSANVVNRLASGAYQIGFGDIASLIKYNTLNPDKRVMALYNQFPADLSIVSLKGRGITAPADLKGKTIGAPTGDTAYKMFAAFAAKNNLSDSDIKWEHMAITLREPMLIQGKVDAITANESTAYFALKGAGVADSDMVFIRYPEHGVNLIGSGLMANESYIKEHPDTIRKIVRAFNHGWEDSFTDPQASLDAALKRDPLLKPDIEMGRLKYAINGMVGQPDAKKAGIGAYTDETVAASIDIIDASEKLSTKIAPKDVADMSFLPPLAERHLPTAKIN
jgi:NitT/TauT family transport system substrate-binding protein